MIIMMTVSYFIIAALCYYLLRKYGHSNVEEAMNITVLWPMLLVLAIILTVLLSVITILLYLFDRETYRRIMNEIGWR